MDFTNPRPNDQLADIVLANSAAGDDCEAIARPIHQISNCRSTLQSRRRASRCEDTANADLNQLLECLRKVVCGIKRAVESHGQSRGRAHQSACALDVYASVRSQDTGYNSGDMRPAGMLDVAQHFLDLVIGVNEAAASGPNHHEHGKFCRVENARDQTGARSGSPHAKVRAELDAVGTRALGSESGCERLYCCFDEDWLGSNGFAASVSLHISRSAHS